MVAPHPHPQTAQAPLTMDEEEEDSDTETAWLQLRPVEPSPSQCCGGGCSPCVFDLYHRDLAKWEAARASRDRSLLNGEKSQSRPFQLNPETFVGFCISAMEKVTRDTYRVRFALPGNSQLGLWPGQHLILRGRVNDLEIQRAYTPISPANAKGYFDVLIKCYQTGLMSQYVESWRPGDTAFWRGPFGGFFYKPNQHGELLMLAAGTGLAPMVPILQSITDNEEDETFVTLVCCFKTFEGVYLKTFLQEQARFWNVRTFFVLSQIYLFERVKEKERQIELPSTGLISLPGWPQQLRWTRVEPGARSFFWMQGPKHSGHPLLLSQESSAERLPWSYQEKTRFGRLGQALVEELLGCCRKKPFALVCGSAEFTKDMARCLRGAGLAQDSYFLF